MTTAICQLCENHFEQAKFHPYQIYCSRKCALNGWRKNNPEKSRAAYRRNNKSKKGKERDKRFRRSKKRKEWLKKYSCSQKFKEFKEYQKQWENNNPKSSKQRLKKYRKTLKGKVNSFKNSERRRVYHHFMKFNLHEAQRIIARDKVCIYCGSKGNSFDHIIPLSKGGTTEYNNLVFSCKPCNCSKHNKDVHFWCKERHMKVPGIIVELLELQKEQKTIKQS